MDHEYATDVQEGAAHRVGSRANSRTQLTIGDRVAAARALLEARSERAFRDVSATRRAQYEEAVELLRRVGVEADAADADSDADAATDAADYDADAADAADAGPDGCGRRMARDHR